MRLLAYSHDTVGLGHLRRTLGICDELVHCLPQVTALVITGSPMAEGFRLPERTDYVKLPSVRKLGNASYASRSLALDFGQLSRLRSTLIRDTVRSFDPDVVLVDKAPVGVNGELRETLFDLQDRPDTRVVLGLRDILDDPEELAIEWRNAGHWEAIEAWYDAVWVYGSPELFDTVREYGFPAPIAARTTYVGHLPRYNGLLPRSVVERELDLDGRRLVLVTGGGGEDGYPLLDTYLRDLAEGPPIAGVRHCMVTGPGMPEEQRDVLCERAKRLGVSFLVFSSHMTSLIAAADVVVSMGGYNTTMEALSLRRRTIVVPRIVPRTEQLIRAERLAARGLVRMIHPQALRPGVLLAAVREELEVRNGHAAHTLAFDGHAGVRRELQRLRDGAAPVRARAGETRA